MHLVSFDLDGTLIDTKALNIEAYRRVGVDFPTHAWGLRWQSWLPDLVGGRTVAEKVHDEKMKIYAHLLEYSDLRSLALPPAQLARILNRQDNTLVQVLTAASQTTTHLILDALGITTTSLAYNLSYEAKRLALHSSVMAGYRSVTYIDDDVINVPRFREDVPHLNVIHYTDQSFNELINQLIGVDPSHA